MQAAVDQHNQQLQQHQQQQPQITGCAQTMHITQNPQSSIQFLAPPSATQARITTAQFQIGPRMMECGRKNSRAQIGSFNQAQNNNLGAIAGTISSPFTLLNQAFINYDNELQLQKKFKKYLILIFRDLCIKHNAQGVSQFALLKYSNLPGYLNQRLYLAMLHMANPFSQNGMKVHNLQNSTPPPDGITANDSSVNHGANILRRNRESIRKTNLINENQFTSGMARIYMTIDDETRAQFLFDIFDVRSSGVLSQADTKILLYHSLDWNSIQLQNSAGGGIECGAGIGTKNCNLMNSNNQFGNCKNNQNPLIPPVICEEILSSGQQSPQHIRDSVGNNNNHFGFSIPNVQPTYNRSALLFSEMLGGSNFSLKSDKRLLVARIIEITFGQKDQLNFADFQNQGRLLSDLIFTQLILNLPCSLYFNTAKQDIQNSNKDAMQHQSKMMMMQNQNHGITGQIMAFNSQMPMDVLQSNEINRNAHIPQVPQISGMNNQALDLSQQNVQGHGTQLVSAYHQDGAFEVPLQHSFNKQHSFILGINQQQNKESYNNLCPNFPLALNKAVVRIDNGESAGSNRAQYLRSVLATQNQQQQQIQNQKMILQQQFGYQSQQNNQQLMQISQNNNARANNILQITPSNLMFIGSGAELNLGSSGNRGGPVNIITPAHSTKPAIEQSHEFMSKTLNSNQSPKHNNKEIGKLPSNVIITRQPNPIGGAQQQNVSSQAMIMMRSRDPQGGVRQSKIFFFKTGEEFKQIQVNKSEESSPNRASDQGKLLHSPVASNQPDFTIKIHEVDEQRKELQQPIEEVEVLESDCSIDGDIGICNEFQHPERQSIMLQVNVPYFSKINSNYDHMKSFKDQQIQENQISPQLIMDEKMSNFDDSVFQSPCLKNKFSILNRNREFSGVLIDGNMGSMMSGFTPNDFGSGIVQNNFADHLSALGTAFNARGHSQNPTLLRRQMVTPLQKMFKDKVNPSQLKVQKSSFYNPNNNRGGSMSPFKECAADMNQIIIQQNMGNIQKVQLRQPLTMKPQHVTMPDDVQFEKILTFIPIQRKAMEGHVYLKNSADQSILKYFLIVKGHDIYCYTSEAKRKLKFMHSLYGCFVQELPSQQLPIMPSVPNSPVDTFYPVEVRLSHICKRMLYFSDDQVRQMWIRQFKEACNQMEFGDFYRMGDYMAEGSFGKVFKGYHRDTGRLVAVKQISKSKMEESELEVQTNEIELLKVIDHPNIVQLIDYFEDPQNIYLVLEHLQGYNLMKFIADKQTLNEVLCKRIMRDIFNGLSYLHEIGIVHRDIKLDNIMMNVPTLETSIEYAIPKLIDFGLATVLMPRETRTEGFGTIAYCSPEIILRKPYTYATDIWSMGVVFYVLLSGFFPFMAYEKKLVVKNILQARIQLNNPQIFQTLSEESKNLLLKMLLRDQKQRINAQQILQDVWFHQNGETI